MHQVGIPCVVLEQAPHLREAGAAIMMQSNAWRALEQLGVADELRATHMAVDWCAAVRAQHITLHCTEELLSDSVYLLVSAHCPFVWTASPPSRCPHGCSALCCYAAQN